MNLFEDAGLQGMNFLAHRIEFAELRQGHRGLELRHTELAPGERSHLFFDLLRVVGAQEGRDLTIDGPEVALRPKAAETLGLAIHELATNAIKHGSLASGGAITIAWTIDAERRLALTWTEHGGSTLVEQPRHKGFGSEILERTLAYELKATTRMEFGPGGLVCRIELPLEQVGTS